MEQLLRRQFGPATPPGVAYCFKKEGNWPASVWQLDGAAELYFGFVSFPSVSDAPAWLSGGAAPDAAKALETLEAACDCVEPWGPGIEARDCWFWTPYSLCADKWTLERPLAALAGDAAHLLSPVGGFGMNVGVGDAASLGWRLAAVLNGWLEPGAALSGYEAERREAWARCNDYVVSERARLMSSGSRDAGGRGGAYETALLGPCVDCHARVGLRLPSLHGVNLEARGVTLVVVGDDLAAAVEPVFRAACDRIGIPCLTCSVDGAEAAVATAFGDHRLAICRPDGVVTHLSAGSLPEGIADADPSVAAESLLLGAVDRPPAVVMASRSRVRESTSQPQVG